MASRNIFLFALVVLAVVTLCIADSPTLTTNRDEELNDAKLNKLSNVHSPPKIPRTFFDVMMAMSAVQG